MSISELCEAYIKEFHGNEMFETQRIRPTQMGERLLREFSAFCDERLTQRAADLAVCTCPEFLPRPGSSPMSCFFCGLPPRR